MRNRKPWNEVLKTAERYCDKKAITNEKKNQTGKETLTLTKRSGIVQIPNLRRKSNRTVCIQNI